MAGKRAAVLGRAVRSVAGGEPPATDRDLLRRFARDGDQAAFRAVVERHAAMVLGVCRRALPTVPDAEDACQAVFVVLAGKAAGRWQPSVANWRYATARKVARNARVAADRRARREAEAAVPEAVDPVDRMTGRELLAALDAALDALPPQYREPLVLCYLEGLTRDRAAARLGVPLATLHTRVDRGRKRLHAALTKAGCTPGAGLLALATTSPAGASPPRLVASVLSAASGSAPAAVGELAKRVVVSGAFNKAALALVVAGAAVLSFGLAGRELFAEPRRAATRPQGPAAKEAAKPKAGDKDRVVRGTVLGFDGKPVEAELSLVGAEGDPLPLGKTKPDGRFEVTVPPRYGRHDAWLVAKAAGYGMDFRLPLAAAGEVTLALPKERPVRGRVLDLQGKPMAGAAVVATCIGSFDSPAAAHEWPKKAADPFHFAGPHADRSLEFEYGGDAKPGRRSPYTATTDKDGRFEIRGAGAGQLVTVRVRAAGLADTAVLTLNRDGFDPGPINKAVLDNQMIRQMLWKADEVRLAGPDPTVLMEPEKLIRGTVTDPAGKPRAGVRVTFSRARRGNFGFPDPKRAVTDEAGRYEIRGSPRHTGYTAECPSDPEAGLLPCRGVADDTPGFEPVVIDLKCAKGVVVTGTVRDKATRKPVPARLDVEVLENNPFVKKYPLFPHQAGDSFRTDGDGRFRAVTVPGPVVLMALPASDGFKRAGADPKHPGYFSPNESGDVMFHKYSEDTATRGFVRGAWCKVLDLKPADAAVTVDIELEPARAEPLPGKPAPAGAERGQGPKETEKMPGPAAKAAVAERTITGKVLGSDGKPVQAELALVWYEGKEQPLGKTKPDGAFELTVPFKLKKDGGWLVARAPGHGPDFQPHGIDYFFPRSMTPTAEVTLRLPPERPIRGRVLDQQGRPVGGASVVAFGLSAFDSDASAERHLKRWANESFLRGQPPDGDRGLSYPTRAAPGGVERRSPYTATTDRDGRFAIAGVGAGQLVMLSVRAGGLADRDIVTLNRDGFDPEPTNRVTRAHVYKEFGGKWVLDGPDPAVVLEPEKVIRGTVTDPAGNPRAGVTVTFTRSGKREWNHDQNRAVTGPDGRYEIRGARKHKGYMVEVEADPAAGLLPCTGFADDTAGYQPVTIDLRCAKGVVVTGTVTNKATGEPVACHLYVEVMANNPFVGKYPPFLDAVGGLGSGRFRTGAGGRFRVVAIPGPVLLMAAPEGGHGGEFKPPAADPKYPGHFHRDHGLLTFDHHGGGRGIVQGNWCKVIDAKATDAEVTIDVPLEPAPRAAVKVVDADGKPVSDTHAAGVTHVEFEVIPFPDTDALTVFNLEPKAGRLLAVVHPKRKLVGTAVVKADDKNPVVRLGAGGRVTGRAVGPDGKPLAGLSVYLRFARREVTEAYDALTKGEAPATDATGEFRLDAVFPGQEFRLLFFRDQKQFGPDYGKAPKHTIAGHGDTLKLGDLKLEPAPDDGEE